MDVSPEFVFGVGLVVAIVQALKQVPPLARRTWTWPILAVIVAVGAASLARAAGQIQGNLWQVLAAGVAVGLAAMGAWSGVKSAVVEPLSHSVDWPMEE